MFAWWKAHKLQDIRYVDMNLIHKSNPKTVDEVLHNWTPDRYRSSNRTDTTWLTDWHSDIFALVFATILVTIRTLSIIPEITNKISCLQSSSATAQIAVKMDINQRKKLFLIIKIEYFGYKKWSHSKCERHMNAWNKMMNWITPCVWSNANEWTSLSHSSGHDLPSLRTEKYFRNLIESNSNQIDSDWFGTANAHCPFVVPNQSENGQYNLILVWFNEISKRFLCTQLAPKKVVIGAGVVN